MDGDDLRSKWDGRYADSAAVAPALEVLVDNAHLLPQAGDALDLASGLGGSALFLARRGLRINGLEDLVVGLPSPAGIALDLAAGKMYWADQAVRRADLEPVPDAKRLSVEDNPLHASAPSTPSP